MESTRKQEYQVRDLPTRSVTLFPTRAQVVRDIKNVFLQPGTNQITIVGFSPTVEEESIKVEGCGSAMITDIAVELLPNRDIFEEIYSSGDEDSEDDESDDDSDEQGDGDNVLLTAVRCRIDSLRDELAHAVAGVASADAQLAILDAHYNRIHPRHGNIDIVEAIAHYRAERLNISRARIGEAIHVRNLEMKIHLQSQEESKLAKSDRKERRKHEKASEKGKKLRRKAKAKKQRRREEVLKEKQRLREERESFWPRKTYTVRISLEAGNLNMTPMTSRRSSATTDILHTTVARDKDASTEAEKSAATAAYSAAAAASSAATAAYSSLHTCDISISYVTSAASWTPSYDLSLSTISNTGILCFDAQLTNKTSETWGGCKIVLSTSQATFSGIKDAIPVLHPWRVKLAPRGGQAWDDIVDSREERTEADLWRGQQNLAMQQAKPRTELFGVGSVKTQAVPEPVQLGSNPHQSIPFSRMQQSLTRPPGAGGSMRRKSAAPKARGARDGLMRSASSAKRKAVEAYGQTPTFGDSDESEGEDEATILPEQAPELAFPESLFQETGLSETYDLPGLKTLAPGHTASKQRVVRVPLSALVFSHTVVAKYKPAAFLKVRIQNRSKLTLLNGPVGLTLDGSFMGRSKLPRCSSGDLFTMSLGIDPAIKVAYPKPEVKRSMQGLFAKEDNHAFTRAITLINTRTGINARPAALVVYDQVPVSEDERLHVHVLEPHGLAAGMPGVPDGVPYKDPARGGGGGEKTDAGDKNWGKAIATRSKENVVTWDVTLNAGRGVRLGLKYTIGWPTNEHVMQC
ncbi:hypothetical protein RB597_007036 [Gaeumannomyces tritici]